MRKRTIGIFLAGWSFAFACVHMAWALGWRAGVPAGSPPIAERPVFLVYDVVAGLSMYAAAWVALLLVRGGLPRRTQGLLVGATVVGSGLALARGAPALVWDVGAAELTGVGFGADIWFTVAGVAGLLLARAVARSQVEVAPARHGRSRGSQRGTAAA